MDWENEIAKLLEFFKYEHLQGEKREMAKRFADLAHAAFEGQADAQSFFGLQELLSAKDCAVRSVMRRQPQG